MPTPHVTPGLHHITLVASDARRTLAFYRDILGLRLVKRTVNFDDPGASHLYLGDATGAPGTLVTFFEWRHAPRGRPGLGGVHHLALGTRDADTLRQWKRYLTGRGVPVSGPLPRGYFESLYFRDPDGQVLEIATLGPGYAIDEPADRLGAARVVPPVSRLPDGRDEAAIAADTWPEPVPAVSEAMRLTGLHHVTGFTDDLSRMHEFLDQALGVRLVKQTVNQDDPGTLHWFWATYDGTTVAPRSSYTLFGWPATAPRARGGVGQAHHLAFRVPDAEAQGAWREHLLSLGLAVSPVMDRTYFHSVYFRAPDGMLFELATDGPGFTADESLDALGSSLRLPAWLEPERERIADALGRLE